MATVFLSSRLLNFYCISHSQKFIPNFIIYFILLYNGSPIGWCRPTEQTVTKYRRQQR